MFEILLLFSVGPLTWPPKQSRRITRATHYLGQYFRRHLGRGLKRFVDESRVHALQQELRFSDKTVSQLAFEYGFAGESHLSKTFKAVTQETPLRYRTRTAARRLPAEQPVQGQAIV